MANSPCNLPLQAQKSPPPPSNRATYCSSGVIIPSYSPSNTQSVRVPTTPAHFFFLRQKIPASQKARVGTSTVSLARGANREVKEKVKGKASRVQSTRIGSALVCVRRNVQHREAKTLQVHTICARYCRHGCCTHQLRSKSSSTIFPKHAVTRKKPHKP